MPRGVGIARRGSGGGAGVSQPDRAGGALAPSLRWVQVAGRGRRADPGLRQRPALTRTVQGVLEGGAHAQLGSGVTLGAQLAYEEGRKASESSLLRERNVADLGAGASYGVHAEWETQLGAAPVLLLARVRSQVRSDRGARADLRAT